MDLALGFLFSIVGLAVLAVAADQFVKGAARLAVLLHVSPVVVGAIVVGFGTSAPEMVLSGLAAFRGDLDLGVGNIIGSNVANISLVLGSAALITAIPVSALTVKRDGLTSVLAVVVFALVVQNGLNRWEGSLLIGLLVIWLFLVLRGSKSKTESVVQEDSGKERPDHNIAEFVGEDKSPGWVETLRTVFGLIFVVVSAYLLVDGADRIAEAFELSGGFVGYTLVAVGTSAPELVTAIAAARQRETDLMVGNVLGSNVFNSLAVGGLISIVGPGPIPDIKLHTVGAAIMALICILSWCTMAANHRVTYRDSIVLLSLWLGSIFLLATG
ncbi:MAG: calcium/sodium antiporter [Acidimicrobiaceae bacterium]|nr:calcium/sodium antiporter [Acidimicrobiaceae bacterium]